MHAFLAHLRKWIVGERKSAARSGDRTQPRQHRRSRFEQLESRELLTVAYHGGALLNHVEAQAVYLGSDWASNAALNTQAGQIDQFLGYVVNSPYMDMLSGAGYNVGRGSAAPGQELNLALNKSSGITDAQIQSQLQSAIRSGQLAAPDANRLYVVYVEPGVVVKLGTSSSQNSFLGYHGAFAGKTAAGQAADIRYAVMPYPGSPNPSASSQGFPNAFDELTAVSSHELAEAVTDPDVNYKAPGWYDDRLNGEIGDLTSRTTRLNGYLVQDVVGKNDQVLVPADTGAGGSGTGNGGSTAGGTVSLSPPTDVTAAVLTTTSASLSWKGSAGAAGYRIYLDNSNGSTLLGTVAASRTSVTVTGLTPGSQVTFHIEAYSGTTKADSSEVTLLMPSPPSLAPPQVTAIALSPTAAQLSWNAVQGASSYRIYLWDGFRTVYLGSVAATKTSVTITGLRTGSTVQFLVEAVGNGAVADSSWTSITTPARASRFRSPRA